MRVLLALALLAFGITSARPADLPGERGVGQYSYRAVTGTRAAQSVTYQYEAGVLVRAYWRAPWRHRHYFPTTGEQPEIGRDEDLSATGGPLEPAESYHRYWSTSSAFSGESPRAVLRALDQAPPAGAEPRFRNPDQNLDAVKP
jgi:hypothetical protein